MSRDAGVGDTIRFAEKILELLGEGRFTATYKFAVLLALMDLCFEKYAAAEVPPDSVTTRQLAEKVIEIYWPQTVDYHRAAGVLRQNAGGQAQIPAAIVRFRRAAGRDPSASLHRTRSERPQAYERLVREVEWTLIEMPLPRLQTVGSSRVPFIYEIGWDEAVRRGDLRRDFDNVIRFKPGAGEHLIQLNGLLRPLVHRRWASMVARFNRLPDSELEDFLFGMDRTSGTRVRAGLWDIQGRRCFYCTDRIAEPHGAEIDHFLPWSRYPDNGIENLVVAHRRCNGDKRDFLAANDHVENWARRFAPQGPGAVDLAALAQSLGWERDPGKTQSAARALYLRLPGDARLWRGSRVFEPPDFARLRAALCAER